MLEAAPVDKGAELPVVVGELPVSVAGLPATEPVDCAVGTTVVAGIVVLIAMVVVHEQSVLYPVVV